MNGYDQTVGVFFITHVLIPQRYALISNQLNLYVYQAS